MIATTTTPDLFPPDWNDSRTPRDGNGLGDSERLWFTRLYHARVQAEAGTGDSIWADRVARIEDRIATSNRALVFCLSDRFSKSVSQVNHDDLRSDAFAALSRAIRTFDLAKKAKFGTWAYVIIVNALRRRVIDPLDKPRRHNLPGVQRTFDREGGIDFVDPKSSHDQERAEVVEAVRHATDNAGLSFDEKAVIECRFGSDLTLIETGKRVGRKAGGLTRSRIAQLEKSALEKIEREFTDPGYHERERLKREARVAARHAFTSRRMI